MAWLSQSQTHRWSFVRCTELVSACSRMLGHVDPPGLVLQPLPMEISVVRRLITLQEIPQR